MQSEWLETQKGVAYVAMPTSREGLEEILKKDKEERLKMLEQSKEDIVGFLHDLPAYLNPEAIQESQKETRIFGSLTDYVKKEGGSFDIQDTILCLANEYGMAAEESGFRNGFQTAMRLCMEGLNGGVGR